MAKQVWGVVASADDQQLIVRLPNGDLRQVTMDTIRIDNVQLTNTVDQTKTYTIWGDAAQTINKGTFDVLDGLDGAGNSIPDYQAGATYEIGATAVDDDGFVYRATAQTIGNKPKTGDTVHASWELINLGGLDITHDTTRDYTTDDVILREWKLYSPVMPITASWAEPVAFVEGYGADEWYNIATGLFKYHLVTDSYVNDEIVRVGNRLFQANNNIVADTAFVEGGGDDEFRPVWSNRTFQHPIVTDYVWPVWAVSANTTAVWSHTFSDRALWATIEIVGAWAWRGRTDTNTHRWVASWWAWGYAKYISNTTLQSTVNGVVWRAVTITPANGSHWMKGWDTSIIVWASTATVIWGHWAAHFWGVAIMAGWVWWNGTTQALAGWTNIETNVGGDWQGSYISGTSSTNHTKWLEAWNWGHSKYGNWGTGATPININAGASVSTSWDGFGYWAAAEVKGATSSVRQQHHWGQGLVRITEYFS